MCFVAGYDDENGSYIKNLHDHIAYRYEIKEVIGKGSFGKVVKVLRVTIFNNDYSVVFITSSPPPPQTLPLPHLPHTHTSWQCFDHKTGQPVALKIIRNKKRFHHQALVEVKILDSLRKRVSEHDDSFHICFNVCCFV